ncbi:hypothetical protein BU24DRAFT_464246 [Aaosphaeria arxii CBS 175.79]|uniref:Uncharacterized protein n=1 Tax=Aaosphaeria arxii CBS 175.79 TaxID=1450172 RepID=A0A6A5XL58_9PLEO|nr:uncharacterized protein BU24DRAFT_464246 [Aaosphaeria arxii CBS 175.79]KAF2013470.1 hypothetical protein BU24DRAFT_464246 [Aaosphaeria arxii CBS 175.79]
MQSITSRPAQGLYSSLTTPSSCQSHFPSQFLIPKPLTMGTLSNIREKIKTKLSSHTEEKVSSKDTPGGDGDGGEDAGQVKQAESSTSGQDTAFEGKGKENVPRRKPALGEKDDVKK